MSKMLVRTVFVGVIAIGGGIALAQESEFQAKIQEDLNSLQPRIVNKWGATDKLDVRFEGKLGGNPRQTAAGDHSSVSTLCKVGLEAIEDACGSNKVVHDALSKLTTITCTRGKGSLSYAVAGSQLTLSIDTSFGKTNPAGQRDDLKARIKKDLDK